MFIQSADTIFIVGAGFSHHAGLPLTNNFTEAMLEAREFGSGPSRMMVDFLSKFIHDAFDHHQSEREAMARFGGCLHLRRSSSKFWAPSGKHIFAG